MSEFNLYCDESNHLMHSAGRFMTLGFISCEKKDSKRLNIKIREIKRKHGLHQNFELKWTKVSKSKMEMYKDIVRMFHEENITFRCIIADKKNLDPKRFNMNSDDWYYKMYFLLLGYTLDSNQKYNIYIDRKDTCSKHKVRMLHEVLVNHYRKPIEKNINKIQQIESYESELMQMCDLFIGAIGYCNNGLKSSKTKLEFINFLEKMEHKRLFLSTARDYVKFNLFKWEGQ